jgi:hypothetical protein
MAAVFQSPILIQYLLINEAGSTFNYIVDAEKLNAKIIHSKM